MPEWASPEELAGGEIPGIDVPEDTFEPIEEPENQPIEEPREEPDPEIIPEWASPEELAGGEIPEIDVPEDAFEPIEEPEQEPDPEIIPEWASPEELAGGEIPGIEVPEDTFEPIEELENQPIEEPIEEPEQEPDPEIVPEWASPEELAGGEIPEIDVPEDTFEPIEEPEQEPDPEIIPEWASPEELAGGEIPEIEVPEDTFEPIEEPESQPIEEPIEEPDPEIVPEWASPEELAGGEIPEIEVPEGTFEPIEPENQPIEEPEQEPISSPEQESKQEKNYESIDESTTESYSETIQKGNRTLIMADNFSSSYSDKKSFEGTTTTGNRREQKKIEKKIPRKTKKTHIPKKDSGSDNKSISRQKSGQSTILVLKPELKRQEKEKETKKKIEKKQLKKENQENEINEAKNEERQDKPKIEKLDEEKEAPKELTNKSSLERRKDTTYFRKITKKLDDSLKKKAEPKQEKQKEQENEEKSEFKEDWEILLKKWIKEADEKEISKEIQKELIEKIRKYRKFREIAKRLHQLLEKKILSEKEIRKIKELKKESDNLQDDLFENLRAFRGFYNKNIDWFKYKIISEKDKFIKYLTQKLENLKKIKNISTVGVFREQVIENWREILKENLYKNITLNLNEKSIIHKILQKDKLDEEEIKVLVNILSKLPTIDIISLLGHQFKQHTQNYIKWGWDYDLGLKRLMLKSYLKRKITNRNDRREPSKNLVKGLKLERNEKLAEFISIMLGDGHLNEKIYRLQISLNGIEEPNYLTYIRNFMKLLFDIDPKEIWEFDQKNASGNEKGMFLYIDNKEIFNELISHGLKPGNKTQNQIYVPNWIKKGQDWIKKNKKLWFEHYIPLIIGSLRGLLDTDGSIFVVKKRASLRIEFCNASLPLVNDFKEMCESLGIKTQPKITKRKWKNERTGNISISYKTIISNKEEIAKFILIVQPKKWEFKKQKFEDELNELGSSLKKALKYENKENLGFYAIKIINSSQNNNQNVDNINLILRSLKEKRDNLRIIINKGDIKVVYHTLKENGYSIQKISSLIGSDIKGPLYRGDTMKFKNFRALKNLFKKYSNNDIPYSYKDS